MIAPRKTVVTTAIALLVAAGLYEAGQTCRLQGRVDSLRQHEPALLKQIASLKTENERLSNQVARIRDATSLSSPELRELLQLRGRAAMAQADAREMLQLKAALADENGQLPDYLLNSLAKAMRLEQQMGKKRALDPLARMKEALHLTDEQALTVSNAAMLRVERETELEFDMFAHRATSNDLARAAALIDQQDDALKAILDPEQLAAYPEYLQKEKTLKADNSARSEAGRLAENFKLSTEQQDKIRALLYELNLKTPTDPLDLRGMLQAATSVQPADAVQAALRLKTSLIEEKLRVLGDILTPEQIRSYREDELQSLNMEAAQVRLLMPRPIVKSGF